MKLEKSNIEYDYIIEKEFILKFIFNKYKNIKKK